MIASQTHEGVSLSYKMSSNRPTLRQLVSVLSNIAYLWYDLGIQLDIDPDVLKNIGKSKHFEQNDCMRRMLEMVTEVSRE